MRWLLLLAVSMLAGCGSLPNGEQTVDALITNTAAVDGCSWQVEVGETRLAPDSTSLKLLVEFGTGPARISYRHTGNAGVVICGLQGTKVQLPEIHLSAISKP